MSLEIGDNVICNGVWMYVEEVDGEHFFGSDQDGESNWYHVGQVDHKY